MADTNTRSQLIDIIGLSVFKERMDSSVDEKIAEAGQGVTYTLSKNDIGEIVLTGSDKSETKVTDKNTTYAFTQEGTKLTITPSDGSPIEILLGDHYDDTIISNRITAIENKESTWDAKSDFSGNYDDLSNKPDLSVYALTSEAGYDLGLSIDVNTYVMTLELKNKIGTVLATRTLDFPIESMVVGASYSNGKITLTLQNGQTLDVDISALVGGLVNDSFTIAGINMKDDITASELKTALGVPTVTDTYSSTSSDAMSGMAVASAIADATQIVTSSFIQSLF